MLSEPNLKVTQVGLLILTGNTILQLILWKVFGWLEFMQNIHRSFVKHRFCMQMQHFMFMEKIVKKGDEYVEKEIGRIGRIIQKGSITRTKFADMVLKGNVLEAFVVATE